MIIEFFKMGGYGFYVWLSFGISIFFCLTIYLKTLKTLKKYQKEFSEELNKLSTIDREKLIKKSKLINQILVSSNKTI